MSEQDSTGSGTGSQGGGQDSSTSNKDAAERARLEERLSTLEAEAKRARDEAASYRTKLREAEQKIADAEGASMSEADKLRKKVQQLEESNRALNQTLKDRSLNDSLAKLAKDHNVVDTDTVIALVSKDDLVNDEGAVDEKEATNRIKKLLTDKPFLAGGGAPQPDPTNPSRTPNMPTDNGGQVPVGIGRLLSVNRKTN